MKPKWNEIVFAFFAVVFMVAIVLMHHPRIQDLPAQPSDSVCRCGPDCTCCDDFCFCEKP